MIYFVPIIFAGQQVTIYLYTTYIYIIYIISVQFLDDHSSKVLPRELISHHKPLPTSVHQPSPSHVFIEELSGAQLMRLLNPTRRPYVHQVSHSSEHHCNHSSDGLPVFHPTTVYLCYLLQDVVVLFYSKWCLFCKSISSLLLSVSGYLSKKTSFKFYRSAALTSILLIYICVLYLLYMPTRDCGKEDNSNALRYSHFLLLTWSWHTNLDRDFTGRGHQIWFQATVNSS